MNTVKWAEEHDSFFVFTGCIFSESVLSTLEKKKKINKKALLKYYLLHKGGLSTGDGNMLIVYFKEKRTVSENERI